MQNSTDGYMLGIKELELYDNLIKQYINFGREFASPEDIDDLFTDKEDSIEYYTCDYRNSGYEVKIVDDGYKFFDDDLYTYPNCGMLCYHSSDFANLNKRYYIKYTYGRPTKVYRIKFYPNISYPNEWAFKIQGSLDGQNFTDISGEWQKLSSAVDDIGGHGYIDIVSPQSYKSYKILWGYMRRFQQNGSWISAEPGDWENDSGYFYTNEIREIKLVTTQIV